MESLHLKPDQTFPDFEKLDPVSRQEGPAPRPPEIGEDDWELIQPESPSELTDEQLLEEWEVIPPAKSKAQPSPNNIIDNYF